jgi:uncharacterized protein YdeI (BOF family)
MGLLFTFSISKAQFVENGSLTDTNSVIKIKENALRLAWSEQRVKVKGFITEQFDEDYFWFEDQSGRIKMEIEPKNMPDIPFNRNTELIISGEVCYPLIGRTYIEAKMVVLTGKKR